MDIICRKVLVCVRFLYIHSQNVLNPVLQVITVVQYLRLNMIFLSAYFILVIFCMRFKSCINNTNKYVYYYKEIELSN